MSDKKKTCFVITPIGDDNSDIRRHIEGIIDQAIQPAIGDMYAISVSHRDFEIGSINDRIVKRVYESDLVIANITNTNPNVMYELAIRYSSGKPAIVIAEKGTKLPFDVIDENTIFYVNDPAGANELKDKICETEKKIDCNKKDYGPILKAINKIPLYNEVESGAVTGEDVPSEKMMQYIIDRLDNIEKNNNIRNQIIAEVSELDSRKCDLKFYNLDSEIDYKIFVVSEISKIILGCSNLSIEVYSCGASFEMIMRGKEEEIETVLMKIAMWADKKGIHYAAYRNYKWP